MQDVVINVLWVTRLVLPGVLFVMADRFQGRLATAAVAFLTTCIGWAVVTLYAVSAQSLTKDPEDVNGAALVFAATFGWVLPAIVVACTWAVRRYKRRF
ncbi:hypothetical protein [Xanthomonas hortorum]|uniref:Uncharacterized protein n=1 Tax=Xanthomonas hortorum TaxID=56454 RepID=A0AA47ES31_9XANT|nr:hypothetical protein [Xanthomonas hortorum]WAH64315.1 hypothetical protein OEG85_23470 [Xanthomonas hortorum]